MLFTVSMEKGIALKDKKVVKCVQNRVNGCVSEARTHQVPLFGKLRVSGVLEHIPLPSALHHLLLSPDYLEKGIIAIQPLTQEQE